MRIFILLLVSFLLFLCMPSSTICDISFMKCSITLVHLFYVFILSALKLELNNGFHCVHYEARFYILLVYFQKIMPMNLSITY